MSNQAINQELSRVRNLKRAVESEVKLLRSDMENGKLHIRVSQDKSFRLELAETLINVVEHGYDKQYQGLYFSDPLLGKIYYCNDSFPYPYPEENRFRIVAIKELFNDCDYQININWYERISTHTDLDALTEEYLAEYPDEDKELFKDDLVEFVRGTSQYWELVQEIETEAKEEAVGFAFENIKDEVIIEI
jgi:hypothetical protein